MATKRPTAKPKAHRLAEAEAKYETATPVRPLGEMLWLAFEALDEDNKRTFLSRLLENPELREDLSDSLVFIARRDEPTRPWEEFEAEMRRDGLL